MKINILSIFYILTVAIGAILGIDYGQKFTKAVVLAPGAPYEIILTEEARRKDLSGISIRSNKADLERVYGSAAQSLCIRFPSQCITGLKSIVGRSIDDVEAHEYLSSHFGVKLIEDSERSSIRLDLGLGNKSYEFSPEEIIAMNLRDIKSRTLKALNENPVAQPIIDGVTLSVAPFVTQEQRLSFLDSLELAEFSPILGLIDDGSSVAINFVDKSNLQQYDDKKHYHLVFDMGAGSTKATLFSITPYTNLTTVLEFENIGYDSKFGGDALTQSIYNLIFEKLATKFSFDENKELPPRVNARLLETSEKAKIILSANNDYHVSLESIIDDEDFKTVISRQDFEEVNIDNMARITQPILDALKHADLTINDLESVILAGGSSRVPFVQKHLVSLMGEDRISRTVNADESCAIGTTVRGFKLKNKFSNSINKDFEIIEKTYHNYEINYNNEETMVFPKFSKIDQVEKVLLGDLVDDLTIEMYEDGKLLKSYAIEGVLDKTKSLTCNNDESYTKKVFGTFELDVNKIFSLKKIEAECVKEVEEVEDEEEEPIEETSKTNETESDIKKKSIKVLRPVSISLSKPKYPNIKPITRQAKRNSISKLNYLDGKDEFKIRLDNIKNSLEAACYSLRNFISDNEDKINKEIDIEELQTEVNNIIEWLDFESDDSPIEEFEDKLQFIKSQKSKLEKFDKLNETDLSLEGMTKLYKEGSSMLMKIQSRMLDFGSEIHEVRKKYLEQDFDFDKENDRAKLQLARDEEKLIHLDKTLNVYKEQITDLGKLLDDKKFDSKSKLELYETYEAISDSIVSMLADLLIVEQSHKSRLGSLNTKLDKLIIKRQKDEERQRLKEEKKAKKLETQEQEAQEQEQEQDEDDEEKQEEIEEPEIEKDEPIDHDEL